jgi:hypothetical protein
LEGIRDAEGAIDLRAMGQMSKIYCWVYVRKGNPRFLGSYLFIYISFEL